MVGDRIFINMPTSAAAAIDARTGETLWVFNPKSYEEGTTTMTARWNQRGVAYWSSGPDRADERIFFGTGSGYLICVDAKTGRPCADFGTDGRLDLLDGIPRAARGERDWLNALPYSVQSPPIVLRRYGRYADVDLELQQPQGDAARAGCAGSMRGTAGPAGHSTRFPGATNSATRPGAAIHGARPARWACGR